MIALSGGATPRKNLSTGSAALSGFHENHISDPLDLMVTGLGGGAIGQNIPNPFNPETWIPYQLTEDADVAIKIHNVTGELVRTLDLGYKPAALYISRDKSAYWDGRNEAGEQVSSGVYFYSIQAGDFAATKKMVVAK